MPTKQATSHRSALASAESGPASDVNELASLDVPHLHRLATLGTLTAGIAHEINNILTPVLAYAHMAGANPGDRELQVKAIDKAMRGVETASRILHAMLGFAAAGDKDLVADVAHTVQAALDCIGRDPAKDGIRLTVNIPAGTSVQIRPLALEQVVMNLVLNACAVLRNAKKSGGPKSRASHGRGEITITAIERADGTTMIRVADNGPGISDDVAGRLFQPFVTHRPPSPPNAAASQPQTPASSQGGSGLGLAICRSLISQAGGSISASSKPDSGAVFTIILPTARKQHAKAG